LLEELVPRVRDLYVEQLRAFVRAQKSAGKRGAPEVKFELSADGESTLFERISCVDYVENDADGVQVRWLMPDKKLQFQSFSEPRDSAVIDVQSLSWDDVIVSFNGDHPDYGIWFDKWFDPEEREYANGAEFTEKIHSLSVGAKDVVVDFGSAPPRALFDLLDLIAGAGSSRLTLSTTR
jgi:hypothetical protein